jgi:hypothetical protein
MVGLDRNFWEKYYLYILLGICNAAKNSQCILGVVFVSVGIDVLLETWLKLQMFNVEVLTAGICVRYIISIYIYNYFQKYVVKTAQGKTAVSMTLLQNFFHYLRKNYFFGLGQYLTEYTASFVYIFNSFFSLSLHLIKNTASLSNK